MMKYYLEGYFKTSLSYVTQERIYEPLGANFTTYLPLIKLVRIKLYLPKMINYGVDNWFTAMFTIRERLCKEVLVGMQDCLVQLMMLPRSCKCILIMDTMEERDSLKLKLTKNLIPVIIAIKM